MKVLGVLVLLLASNAFAKGNVSLEQKGAVAQAIKETKLTCRDQHNTYYDSSFVASKVEEASSVTQKGQNLVFVVNVSEVKSEKTTVVTDGAKVVSVQYKSYNYELVWPNAYDWVVEDVVTCK
ncbi:MAG: hypothetical protein ACKOX6_14605 [Bdellovibrio sp.]